MQIALRRTEMIKKYLNKNITNGDQVSIEESKNPFKEQEILTRTSQIGIVLKKVPQEPEE